MFSLIDEKAESEKGPIAHHLYGQQLHGHRQASGSRWFYLCIPLSCTSLIQDALIEKVRRFCAKKAWQNFLRVIFYAGARPSRGDL